MYHWQLKILCWNSVESSMRVIMTWVMVGLMKDELALEKLWRKYHPLLKSNIWLWVEERVVRKTSPKSQKRMQFQKEDVFYSIQYCTGMDGTTLGRSHQTYWLKVMGAIWSAVQGRLGQQPGMGLSNFFILVIEPNFVTRADGNKIIKYSFPSIQRTFLVILFELGFCFYHSWVVHCKRKLEWPKCPRANSWLN